MGEHKHKKVVAHPLAALECAASVSVFKIIVVRFVKFLLSVLRVVVFPLGLVWLGVNTVVKSVYEKYPGA